MNKIGIITWYYSNNYGSQLQSYALLMKLRSLGHDARLVTITSNHKLKNIFNIAFKTPYLRTLLFKMLHYTPSLRFIKECQVETYIDKSEGSTRSFDTFVCGSDQIWAPNVFNSLYMLDFVPDDVNKASYAASIGLESIPESMVNDYKKYISRINHVAVREDRGQEILMTQCGIDSTVVVDPTLLLEKGEYDKIKVSTPIKYKYIFCYFLKKDHQYKELIQKFSKKIGYQIVGISDNSNDKEWMHTFSHAEIGPREFIGLIEGAQVVFTDSYHGTIFSMHYHKQFALFERFSNQDKICQNSRIEQLKKYFGINKNILRADAIKEIELAPIDYNYFEKSLVSLREESLMFLKNALNKENVIIHTK